MTSSSDTHGEGHSELVCMYAIQALPPDEVPVAEAQIAACAQCQREVEALDPLFDAFVAWPTDVLRPPASLWDRLAERVSADARIPVNRAEPGSADRRVWSETGCTCVLITSLSDVLG